MNVSHNDIVLLWMQVCFIMNAGKFRCPFGEVFIQFYFAVRTMTLFCFLYRWISVPTLTWICVIYDDFEWSYKEVIVCILFTGKFQRAVVDASAVDGRVWVCRLSGSRGSLRRLRGTISPCRRIHHLCLLHHDKPHHQTLQPPPGWNLRVWPHGRPGLEIICWTGMQRLNFETHLNIQTSFRIRFT